jgi:hypothetical protein
MPDKLGARRALAAWRRRSRVFQPRARRRAHCNSAAVGVPGSRSTICVRHQTPSPSRSGWCTTRPATCRSSSQRCTLRRCARMNAARRTRSCGTGPQPITGANPTTNCPIEVAYRAEPAAWPSRNKYRLTAYTRVSNRSSPGVEQPRSRRARPSSAMTTSRPGSAGNGSIAGRYQRRRDSRDGAADGRSSGTASARGHHGSTKPRARERTLAAQLDQGSTAEQELVGAHVDVPPQRGVGDPSGTRLELRDAFMWLLTER